MSFSIDRAPGLGALLTPPGIIAITGGGGKTSLMYWFVRLLKAQNINAIAATTTKIYISDHHEKNMILVNSPENCLQALEIARVNTVPSVLCLQADTKHPNKAIGVPADWLDAISDKMDRDTVLVVEADGAAGKPLKGHLSHEPVIPQCTRLVIPVIGLDVLGKAIDAGSVHRADRLCQLAGRQLGDMIDAQLIAKLICHPQGYRHNIPENAMIVPLLNKAETTSRIKGALQIGRLLSAYCPETVMECLIGSVKNNWISVRKFKHS